MGRDPRAPLVPVVVTTGARARTPQLNDGGTGVESAPDRRVRRQGAWRAATCGRQQDGPHITTPARASVARGATCESRWRASTMRGHSHRSEWHRPDRRIEADGDPIGMVNCHCSCWPRCSVCSSINSRRCAPTAGRRRPRASRPSACRPALRRRGFGIFGSVAWLGLPRIAGNFSACSSPAFVLRVLR